MQRLSPFTLIVTFVCLALVGLALVPMLPVKLNPSRTLPGFTVRFSMPGTSSRVVEMEATSKLESMLARIKGVKAMYSTSGNGYGSITVDLDKHADVDAVRFEASTIIRQTWSQLPSGVSYPYIDMKVPDENASRPFLSFTLNAPSTPILIQQYAEEHIKPRLAQLQGIYKIDLSEVPVLVGCFAMGPMAGVLVELVKILLNFVMTGTSTAGVGEIANFIIGCSFCVPAGLIYRKNRTRKSALIGMATGTLLMIVIGCFVNGFVLLPTYAKAFGMPIDALVGMGTAVNSHITSLSTFVMFAVAPFNLVKGIVVSLVVFLIYKKISPIFRIR